MKRPGAVSLTPTLCGPPPTPRTPCAGLARWGLLLALAAAPAWGQFALYLVSGGAEQSVPRLYDLGAVEPGGSASLPLRIRNLSSTPATLDYLAIAGTGFSLANAIPPAAPLSLAAHQALDFTVAFHPSGSGQYSASLDSVGINVLLLANVPVELTCQTDSAGGPRSLAAAPLDFGTVAPGAAATRHVTLWNQTASALTVPDLAVEGAGYALSGPSAAGQLVAPTATTGFDVRFTPTTAGAFGGQLHLGDRTYQLTGTGWEPDLPTPRVSLSLPLAGSAQQGSITINLAPPSQSSGTGTLMLTFQAAMAGVADDPGIALASGGRLAHFTVSPGDTQGHFDSPLAMQFQTGTTAGTLTISAQLGSRTDERSLVIPAAPVGMTAAVGVRSAAAIEVDLTGFDNSRSAGVLAFTFYDAAGNALAPGTIRTDSSASFAAYFQTAAGGAFVLRALFPVSGDASQIKAFQAELTNAAGASNSGRTPF